MPVEDAERSVEYTPKHPLARCWECPLQGPENTFVLGQGPEDARIVIIGEAPGFQEAKRGVPFTGPSGKLLDTVLQHHGVDREELRVTNACLCRPPNNATPSPVAAKCCRPRLVEELQGAETIVTLGNVATQSVLSTKEGITKLRSGPPKTSEEFPNAIIIPTFHPAAALRNQGLFPDIVEDLSKIRVEQPVTWIDPDYRVFDDDRAAAALQQLQSRREPVVVDIEVGVEKDEFYGSPTRFKMLSVGFSYAPGKAIIIGEKALELPIVKLSLQRLLETTPLVCHNGKFDLAGLNRYGVGKLYFDTMLASYALDERPGVHGLKYLATEHLGAPDYGMAFNRVVGTSKNYDTAPRDLLYQYNACDVVATYLLYKHYEKRLEEDNTRSVHDFLVQVSNELIYSELEGIKIDEPYLDELLVTYAEKLDKMETGLKEYVNNPRSPKQVKEALSSMGILVASTNAATLQSVLESGNAVDFMEKMLAYRKEQKLYGTYIKGPKRRLRDGRLYPTFLLHGTTTGRLACRNPNLQNVPRGSEIRRLFVPEKGNVFLQGDYKQLELRVVMIQAGERGEVFDALCDLSRDIFDEMSLEFYGPSWTKEQRVRTKAYVHGTNYGREPYSIHIEYKLPLAEATRAQRVWLDKIPKVVEYQQEIKRRVLAGEDLITPFGRKRRFWLITQENVKDVVKEAYAFEPQSIASDINLYALMKMRRDGLHVRIPIHDSILVECPEGEVDEVSAYMKKTMEDTAAEVYSKEMPFPVDIAIGKNWGDLE